MPQTDLLHRAMRDFDFRSKIREDPSAVSEEYDLSDETVKALESGDETRIRDALMAKSDPRAVPNG